MRSQREHFWISAQISSGFCIFFFILFIQTMISKEARFEDISFEEISINYDWVICKDILEHLPYESIDEQLQLLADCTKNLIAMVPLGDGHKYYIDAYEQDVTHIIREDLKWWEERFFRNGFNVDEMTYDMGPFKTNWQIHPQGNGLFCCSTL